MFGVWEALVKNDKANRPRSKVECLKGGHLAVCKSRDALNKRERRRALDVEQSKAGEQDRDQFDTIPELLRAIEGLGCRVICIENLAWQIESSQERRGSCLLIGSYGGNKQKPSRYEGGGARMGRSKKASSRSRNGTRSMGGGEPSHSSDGGSSRMDNEVARSNQIASGCPSFKPSGQSKPIRPRVCKASHPRRNQSNLRYHPESRGGV